MPSPYMWQSEGVLPQRWFSASLWSAQLFKGLLRYDQWWPWARCEGSWQSIHSLKRDRSRGYYATFKNSMQCSQCDRQLLLKVKNDVKALVEHGGGGVGVGLHICIYSHIYIDKFESNLRSNSQMDPSYPANIQPHISVPSLQIMLIMNKKWWTASQTQSALATDSNCFGPKRKTPFHGKFKFFIQSFGVSFYLGWKLSNLTSQNFID